jgi:hypothetical protein
MESYDKAQDVQKVGRETRLERLEAAQGTERERPKAAEVKTPT